MSPGFNRLTARVPAPAGQEWHPWFCDTLIGKEVLSALSLPRGVPFQAGAVITAVEIVEDGHAMMVTAEERYDTPRRTRR